MLSLNNYKKEIETKTINSIPKEYFDNYFNSFINSYFEIKDIVSKNQKILDVGCGGGMLVNYLDINGYDIEGFDNYLYNPHTKSINSVINHKNLVHNADIKSFKSTKKFDVIFMSNVVEHLYDWKKDLEYVKNFMTPDGEIVFLLPNYNFPIEFHFMIPIIMNKKITHKIFKKRIENFEKAHSRFGIWDSLNFIKPIDIELFFSKDVYKVTYDKKYFERLLLRLIENAKNKNIILKKKRNIIHKFLIFFSFIFLKFKMIKIFRYLPLKFHPFIKIIVKKT